MNGNLECEFTLSIPSLGIGGMGLDVPTEARREKESMRADEGKNIIFPLPRFLFFWMLAIRMSG